MSVSQLSAASTRFVTRCPLDEVLRLVNFLLEDAGEGVCSEQRLCVRLAGALDASAAAYVRLELRTQMCTVTCWPHTVDLRRLKAVVQSAPLPFPLLFTQLSRKDRPSCVSADAIPGESSRTFSDRVLWTVLGCHELVQVPLLVSETQLRLLALGRREEFSPTELEFLRAAQQPLGAIDRVVRALERRLVNLDGSTATTQLPEPAEPAGDFGLTPREVEVLRLLAEGLLANTIAARMKVSTRTVHKHLGNVYRKLDAHDRLLAVRRAQSIGLIPVESAGSVDLPPRGS